MSDPEKWDWSSDDAKECMVFPTVSAVAVYQNSAGGIVIRQEAQFNSDEDSFVVIPKGKVPALIKALQNELGKPEDSEG